MSYRSDLDALDARHDALTRELASTTQELDDATRLLEQARARARLPILDNIRVASPCTAEWTAMTGDERTRHCHKCDKQVFNLSDMTRAEAEALLLEKQGKLCARYFRRSDGTIITADCRVGVIASRKRKLIAAGAMALLGTAGGVALQLRNRIQLDRVDEVDVSPTEALTTHVAAGAEREAPPPPPPPMPVHAKENVVETKGEVLMGDVSGSFEDR